jgi:hypothetical protein
MAEGMRDAAGDDDAIILDSGRPPRDREPERRHHRLHDRENLRQGRVVIREGRSAGLDFGARGFVDHRALILESGDRGEPSFARLERAHLLRQGDEPLDCLDRGAALNRLAEEAVGIRPLGRHEVGHEAPRWLEVRSLGIVGASGRSIRRRAR